MSTVLIQPPKLQLSLGHTFEHLPPPRAAASTLTQSHTAQPPSRVPALQVYVFAYLGLLPVLGHSGEGDQVE